jgi:multiple sugar transport system ATP-binding protein
MGSETQVTMKLGDTTVTGVFRERVSLSHGATIRVRPEIASIHLFAADDGQRLI